MEQRCERDEALRAEVESLLSTEGKAGLLDSPITFNDFGPLSIGTRLGPYEVLAPLGTGGMGEVWKARDTRLDRIVAIKRLTGLQSSRFETEARAIAALNHPHICQIHDVGPDYLVLEYIEGEPLRGPLPAEEAIPLAIQIADALVTAHSRGIIHRDLKPANIMITEHQAAKLLDFGLAKLSRSSDEADVTRTAEGAVMGTAAYMAPEQAQGKRLDQRSDIFSFGAVLYEMLSGNRAFGGNSTADVTSAVLRDDPRPLQVSPDLTRIVTRCLRKSLADRFQTMAEVKAALELLPAKPAEPQPSVAVLPFANMSGDKDNEYFSDGLAEEIINALTRLSGLKVIARTSAFAFKGKQEDIRKIADVLGVTNILEGSARKAGNRVRITAQLITAADGSHLWSERYDREMSDIFAIQDEISKAIVDALKAKLGWQSRGESGARRPPNMEAYQRYLEGRYHMFQLTTAGMARSLNCYERSIRLDPNYEAPRAALGEHAYIQAMFMGARSRDVIPAGLAGVSRAIELNPEVAEPYMVRGLIHAYYDWNWRAAGEDLARAIELNPAFALGHRARSVYLVTQRRNEEALAAIRRALDLDPLNILTRSYELWVLNVTGAGTLAVDRARALIDLFGGLWFGLYCAALTLTVHNLHEEAAKALQNGLQLDPGNVTLLAWLGWVRGRQGRPAESERISAELVELAGERYVPFSVLAVASAGCGNMQRYYQLMNHALDERELNAPPYLIDRREDFHSDSRYQALLQRINLN